MGSRTDDQGRAVKKSQRQIQIAVNRHQPELESKLLAALPSLQAQCEPEIEWISPREDDDFREYHDGEMLRKIGRAELIPELKKYWPLGLSRAGRGSESRAPR